MERGRALVHILGCAVEERPLSIAAVFEDLRKESFLRWVCATVHINTHGHVHAHLCGFVLHGVSDELLPLVVRLQAHLRA
jgi:hypothetical protein